MTVNSKLSPCLNVARGLSVKYNKLETPLRSPSWENKKSLYWSRNYPHFHGNRRPITVSTSRTL